jgi:hypothetical protein
LRNEVHIELLSAFEQAASARTSMAKSLSASLAKEYGHSAMPLSCFLRCEGEVAEIGSFLRGAFRPEDE